MSEKISVLIVGIGNPLRSDDGLGWHVAKELCQEFSREDVQIVAAHQLTPEMSELASCASLVIFVDAASSGEPGALKITQIFPTAPPNTLSHELSPAMVLAMTQVLYGHCPDAYVFTIAGESFAAGDTLSATVDAAVPKLKSKIGDLIDSKTR